MPEVIAPNSFVELDTRSFRLSTSLNRIALHSEWQSRRLARQSRELAVSVAVTAPRGQPVYGEREGERATNISPIQKTRGRVSPEV